LFRCSSVREKGKSQVEKFMKLLEALGIGDEHDDDDDDDDGNKTKKKKNKRPLPTGWHYTKLPGMEQPVISNVYVRPPGYQIPKPPGAPPAEKKRAT
jgi:hypothetical protein